MQLKRQQSRCTQCQKKTLSLDIYRRPFQLLLPDGQAQYRTFLGTMLSLLTFFVVVTYAGYKLRDLFEYGQYKVQLRELTDLYDEKEQFGEKDGLMFAAGLTAYDGSSESVEDPQYGHLVFIYKRWGLNTSTKNNEIETKGCTEDDLNDNQDSNPDSPFYRLRYRDQSILDSYGPKMKCFKDPSQLAIWGNFDSSQAQNFQLAFRKCNNETSKVPCKSQQEIEQWMSNKYILVLLNENNFLKHKFGDDTMQKESRIYWYSLTPSVPTE